MTESDNNCQLNKQKTIISTIRRKKLTLFGHICRMPDNRLLKSVLFGSMEGRSVYIPLVRFLLLRTAVRKTKNDLVFRFSCSRP